MNECVKGDALHTTTTQLSLFLSSSDHTLHPLIAPCRTLAEFLNLSKVTDTHADRSQSFAHCLQTAPLPALSEKLP